MLSHPKSERVIATGIVKRQVTVDEKQSLVQVVFLNEFRHEIFRCIVVFRWMKLRVKDIVSVRISSLNRSRTLV